MQTLTYGMALAGIASSTTRLTQMKFMLALTLLCGLGGLLIKNEGFYWLLSLLPGFVLVYLGLGRGLLGELELADIHESLSAPLGEGLSIALAGLAGMAEGLELLAAADVGAESVEVGVGGGDLEAISAGFGDYEVLTNGSPQSVYRHVEGTFGISDFLLSPQ